MQFKRKNELVHAKKLDKAVEIDGEVLAAPGDYITFGEHGQYSLWPAKTFREYYEPALTDQPPAPS